jgi:hypothetical protein
LSEHATPQQYGNFMGIDFIVFALTPMYCFHVEGMTENEGNPLGSTQVSDPVPGKHAFRGNHEVFSVGSDALEE